MDCTPESSLIGEGIIIGQRGARQGGGEKAKRRSLAGECLDGGSVAASMLRISEVTALVELGLRFRALANEQESRGTKINHPASSEDIYADPSSLA